MIEWFESIDRAIVLAVNGCHTPWLDVFMWTVSGKIIWIPFYLFLAYLCYRKTNWKYTGLFVLLAIVAVGLSDFTSSQLIKDTVMRYRPSHHGLLTHRLHFYQLPDGEFYKGGQYGFVSSHAANFFAICTFAYLALKPYYNRMWLLFGVAILVSFSRLYLGVHYLSDLIGGVVLGTLFAWLVYRFVFLRIKLKD